MKSNGNRIWAVKLLLLLLVDATKVRILGYMRIGVVNPQILFYLTSVFQQTMPQTSPSGINYSYTVHPQSQEDGNHYYALAREIQTRCP
jgi:hypothetical protein